ncbi:hypothetical protein WJX77_005652 [Trebouxia sp. C0004]
MHSSEPARKKLKLAGEADKCQVPSKVQAILDSTRDPSNATDTSTSSQGPHSSYETAASDTKRFTVFVIDTDSRLFVAEVTESQQLWSIVEGLASQGCKGIKEEVQLHCRGRIQQDVHQTAAEVQLREGYTISLQRPDRTDRWEAFAELETLFYGLHDSYHTLSEAAGPQGCIPMSDEISEKCKLASEEHHTFLGALYVDENRCSSKAKLLSFLETDSIPVLASMCNPTTRPGLNEFHWAACTRLVCIEGYTTTAMWTSRQKKEPDLFPWVFFLTIELTIAQSGLANTHEDQTTWRQLQKLGETMDTMHQLWNSWSDLLPSSYFDRSAQDYAVMQLSRCITAAAQVITHGLKTVKQQVSDLTSCSIKPDDNASGLEVTVAWSTMVGVFMALRHHLTHEDETHMLNMLQSFLKMLKMLTETCQAVERFAATCIRLGIPPTSTTNDPYTGEPVQDPNTNPYTAAIPLVLRQHLTALLPGILALSHAHFDNPNIQPKKDHELKEWLPIFLTMPVANAVLKVADLKPGGVLHRAVTSDSNELQQHLPDSFRKQYLHELFPDLSLEANFIEEPNHYELVVRRDDVFSESLKADITRGLFITFKGEMGQGSGVMKEWLTLFTKGMFGKRGGVFQQCPGDPATVHPVRAPERGDGDDWPDRPDTLRQAGKLAGLAVCYRCPIGIRLSTACLKMMSGRPVSLEDFQEVDPQLYCTMCAIKSASEEELQAMDLTFESPNGEAFALQGPDEPVGQPVTLANRKNYLYCVFHYFFDCSEQVGHFLEGLCSTSDWSSWHYDEDNETSTDLRLMLRPMVVGDFGRHLAGTLAPLDVDDWRRATVTKDFWYRNGQQELDWFWQMITDMDDDQRRQLLCFWTSTSTVPAGGFQELSSKLKLQASSQGSLEQK